MKNNSKSSIEVKAQGTRKGADEMMKQDAVGSVRLKTMGGISLIVSAIAGVVFSVAKLITAMAEAGLI